MTKLALFFKSAMKDCLFITLRAKISSLDIHTNSYFMLLLIKERIVVLFSLYTCGWTMTTIHLRIVWQHKEFLQAVKKFIKVSAFQICTSTTATEECIAREERLVLLIIETNATLGVSRGGYHLKCGVAKSNLVPIHKRTT